MAQGWQAVIHAVMVGQQPIRRKQRGQSE